MKIPNKVIKARAAKTTPENYRKFKGRVSKNSAEIEKEFAERKKNKDWFGAFPELGGWNKDEDKFQFNEKD